MDESAEPADRATIADSGDALEVSIPVQKDWVRIFFHTVWMIGWVWGGARVTQRLLSGNDPHGDRLFLMAWLGFWAIGVVFGAATWLWSVAGVERIRFRSDAVSLRREVFGVGTSRDYDASRVGKLRLADDFRKGSDQLQPANQKGGKIAFVYEDTTVQFGLRLDRGEAARIILKIQKRFAFTRN